MSTNPTNTVAGALDTDQQATVTGLERATQIITQIRELTTELEAILEAKED